MLKLIIFLAASAHAAVTGLSPSSANVKHERNGMSDYGVAVQVLGTGAFTVSSGTCFSWLASPSSGTAPVTIYLKNFATADNLTVGATDTCAIDIGGQAFTFNRQIVASPFPPVYTTTVNKTADASLSACSKYDVGDAYRGICTSPDPKPGGSLAGWPTSPGGTFTDPIFGGVLTRMTAGKITHTYGPMAMISSDSLYSLNFDLVSGSTGYVYEIATQTQLFTKNFIVNTQSCQWSANPATPRVIWCNEPTGIRKWTVTGTPPSGATDGGIVYTDAAGVFTTVRHKWSLDDTVPYLDSTASNAAGATKLCAVNLNNTSIKSCYNLANLPDPPALWRGLAISFDKDASGYRYIAAATATAGGSASYVRYFRWKDGDAAISLWANGASDFDNSPWQTTCSTPVNCVSGGHYGFTQIGQKIYISSPGPTRQFPN